MGFEKEVMQQYIIANDKAARAQRSSAKQPPIKNPVVLEKILDRNKVAYKIELGVLEIPMNQIVGIAAADQRELLYASNFMPLSKANTEFANTWRHLYQEFLSDDGLRKTIRCYEYLGKFYVQDGAKRVSVLKHHGAATVFSEVIRIMPNCTQERNVQNYYEFLQHFRLTRLYQISFSNPEHFAKLQSALGHEANYRWNDTDRFGFLFHWHTIENAFHKAFEESLSITAADALAVLLEKYTYNQIIRMPVWVLTRVFQANWKQMYELSFPGFSSEKKEQRFTGMLQTA